MNQSNVVAYVDYHGYLRCVSCAPHAEGVPVFEHSKPHCDDHCDLCGKTANTALERLFDVEVIEPVCLNT